VDHCEVGHCETWQHRVVGEATFVCAALANHACEPNAHSHFSGRTIELRAAVALEAGQEVTVCYGPQAGLMALADRQEELSRLYHFRCECVACERETAAVGNQPRAAAAGSSAVGANAVNGRPAVNARPAVELAAPGPAHPTGGADPGEATLRSRAERLDRAARDACERGDSALAARLTETALGMPRHNLTPGPSYALTLILSLAPSPTLSLTQACYAASLPLEASS